MESKALKYSERTTYSNTKPAKDLPKSVLNNMAVKSMMLQASFNFERMQAAGWLWSILPGLKLIHEDKEDLKTSMTHNLEFFNTHPFLVTFVMGIVLNLEQHKVDINTIRAVRTAAMGPLGGIGDALFWFTLIPVTAGITANWAIKGDIAGPILYFLIAMGVQMALRFSLMHWSYKLGTNAIEVLTRNSKEFTHAASMLGVFIVGALTCNYGATRLGIIIPNGDKPVNIQGLMDGILPAMLPLGLTLLCYYLLKKKGWKPVHCITLLLVIGLLGGLLAIWPGGYKQIITMPWVNS